MSIYTRVTVVGASRRVEVVVPSEEPIGSALPRLLDLLGETDGTVARPLTLIAPDGEQLDIARSPQQLDLVDGTLLRVERLDAAPPPPVVIDVTDSAADAHDARPDRWDARAREAAGATGVALAVGAAGLLAPASSPIAGVSAQLALVVAFLALAAGLGLGGLRRASACAAAAAAGLVPAIALGAAAAGAAGAAAAARTAASFTEGADPGRAALLGAAVALATASTVVLVGVGVARRSRGAVAGGALGAVIATVLLVLLLTGVGAAAAAAIAGTLAAFATGPLPWIALSAAGLTTLDQRAAEGGRVSRAAAASSIDDAYAALGWGVALVAAALAVTGIALVLADDVWTGLLATALAAVAVLRSRAFPLRAQVAALWVAVAAIGVAALLTHLAGERAWLGVAAALVTAGVIAAASLASPPPHARARLRSLGNTLETLAVVALLPLLLGVLGIYADLLGMFGGAS